MIKVASVQFAPQFKAPKENLRALTELVSEAAENDAQLVVLPELAATGYSFMSYDDARPFAETLTNNGGPTTTGVFAALSAKYNIVIAYGLMELCEGTGKLYNSQVIVTPDGSYESYRKVNLWGNDFLWASEGRGNPAVLKVDFDGAEQKKVGLLICRDIRDRKDGEWQSFYEPGDADIVAMSSNWGNGGFPAVGWIDFAKDNHLTLVVSNRYGKETPNDFGEGGVCVISPDGKVGIDGLVWSQNCIVYGEI